VPARSGGEDVTIHRDLFGPRALTCLAQRERNTVIWDKAAGTRPPDRPVLGIPDSQAGGGPRCARIKKTVAKLDQIQTLARKVDQVVFYRPDARSGLTAESV